MTIENIDVIDYVNVILIPLQHILCIIVLKLE